MASASSPSTLSSLCMRTLTLSAGLLSLAIALKIVVPVLVEFSNRDVPIIWNSLVLWLKPPYLYIILNGIIITIAASSRCQRSIDVVVPEKNLSLAELRPCIPFVETWEGESFEAAITPEESPAERSSVIETVNRHHDDNVDKAILVVVDAKKPLVSSRFSSRKPVKKSSPQGGGALRVAKWRREDTLENTWKAITEGRAMPLSRHLKKADTWEVHSRHSVVYSSKNQSYHHKVNKSEISSDRTNELTVSGPSPLSTRRLRKDPSLGQDELNRRVEAFIHKFNDEMRLQRQASIDQNTPIIRDRGETC